MARSVFLMAVFGGSDCVSMGELKPFRLVRLPGWRLRVFGLNCCVVLSVAPVKFATRGRGLAFNFARVLVRAPIDEPGFQPTDTKGPHNAVKSVLSCPKCPVATACVSSPKVGPSSLAPTCSRRWSIWIVHQQKCKTQVATTLRRETMFAPRVSTRLPRSPGRAQHADARLKPDVSELAMITPQMCMLLAHACETRVLRPAGRPGRTFNSSRLNWK